LRDVFPTLLDCAGLPIPESVEGRSFLPLARGEAASWRSHLHGEHTYGAGSIHWLTDGQEKYVWFSDTGHEQLFDLEEDPQELRDLARVAAARSRVEQWRDALIQELADREEGFVADGRLVAGRPVRAYLSSLQTDPS
jgi:arylsulfatase A-like enzyme